MYGMLEHAPHACTHMCILTEGDSAEAQAIRERCFTRLTPGQLVDTTMDKQPDSIALDTTGDGTVDKVVPLDERDQ